MKPYILLFNLLTPVFVNSQNVSSTFLRDGNDSYKKQDFPKAIELYKKELAVNSGNFVLNYNMSLAYYKTGNFIDAITNLKKVIEYSKDKLFVADALYNLGIAYIKNNQSGEAIIAFKKSLLSNPNNRLCKENLQLAINEKNKRNLNLKSDSVLDKSKSELNNEQNVNQTNQKGENKNNLSGEYLLNELKLQENAIYRKLQNEKNRKKSSKNLVISW